ncbi:hypothetical protein B4N89_13595 [Embleya scabrispora]|uniref:Uncharacterized protein n=1 Tax=Embleya scabrispora TaxID=159449 RepID=A0A1T3NYQ0_9ACTN|nr:hypothetical protein [Embleya scabrispora]OPC81832.1 hypothetical protein B4N89_13595 [Embleya scabrispora]
MSLIIHRCTCGHTPGQHESDSQGKPSRGCHPIGGCRCSGYDPQPTPVLLPTWTPTGRPIPEITPPGERSDRRRTCDCDACQALYATLTADAGAR